MGAKGRRRRLELPAAVRSRLDLVDEDGRVLLTVGQLSRRSGLPARTIRFWSDAGVLAPVGRSGGGYRLYDAECVARLELVATLRDLGLGLADVRRILDKQASLAEVATAHVTALDAQIRALRLRRAVLSTVAKRGSSTEEMTLMNRLARLSAQERKQIIDDFLDEVFGGVEVAPGLRDHLSQAAPDLPDDPTPEQVDAWVELAELVRDPDFRRRVRSLAQYSAPLPGTDDLGEGGVLDATEFARRVAEHAGAAVRRGVAAESAEAAQVLADILGDSLAAHRRAQLLRQLEAVFTDPPARYWQLLAVINGWPPFPSQVSNLDQVTEALHAHAWVIAALRVHG
jgi:DNA-binding transcriptional MerR regulator